MSSLIGDTHDFLKTGTFLEQLIGWTWFAFCAVLVTVCLPILLLTAFVYRNTIGLLFPRKIKTQ